MQELETHLLSPELRISAYHDMPFAIFRYNPEEEFEMRAEIRALTTRLGRQGRQVREVSLVSLMFEALEEVLGGEEGLQGLFRAEEEHGVERAIDTVHRILTEVRPLDEKVFERLIGLDPKNSVGLLTRAGDLFPVFRTSALLENLMGRLDVPIVLFYPGTLEGAVGLRFMAVCEAEHNYRPKIY